MTSCRENMQNPSMTNASEPTEKSTAVHSVPKTWKSKDHNYRDSFLRKNTHILLGAPHCTNNHTLYLKGLSHDSVSLQYVSSFSCSHHCPCIINLVVLWDKIHYEKPGFQWGVVWGVMGFKSKCSKGSQIEPLGSEHFARNTGFPRGLTTISPYVPCKKYFWGVWHPTSRHCQGSYVCRYIASSTWLLC